MLNTIDSLYDVSDNNRKSKLYSFNHLRALFIKSECFKNEKIRKKTIKLCIKFYKSNFFYSEEKKFNIFYMVGQKN